MRKQLVLNNFDNMFDNLLSLRHDEPLFRWLITDGAPKTTTTQGYVKSYVEELQGATQFQFIVPGAKREEITTTLTHDRMLEFELKCGEKTRVRTRHEAQVIRHHIPENCDISEDATTVDLSDGILTVTFKHKTHEQGNRRLL